MREFEPYDQVRWAGTHDKTSAPVGIVIGYTSASVRRLTVQWPSMHDPMVYVGKQIEESVKKITHGSLLLPGTRVRRKDWKCSGTVPPGSIGVVTDASRDREMFFVTWERTPGGEPQKKGGYSYWRHEAYELIEIIGAGADQGIATPAEELASKTDTDECNSIDPVSGSRCGRNPCHEDHLSIGGTRRWSTRTQPPGVKVTAFGGIVLSLPSDAAIAAARAEEKRQQEAAREMPLKAHQKELMAKSRPYVPLDERIAEAKKRGEPK